MYYTAEEANKICRKQNQQNITCTTAETTASPNAHSAALPPVPYHTDTTLVFRRRFVLFVVAAAWTTSTYIYLVYIAFSPSGGAG